jgi:hypothetical protein
MRRVITLLAATGLLLVACSSSSGSATPDPAIAFCPALDAYGASLIALDKLDASATTAQYKAAAVTARTALAALVSVAGAYAGAQLNALSSAQQDLDAAASELDPVTATPAQAEAAISDELQAVIQEVAGTRNALCNTRPTPSTAP